jgi:hypothetical protein
MIIFMSISLICEHTYFCKLIHIHSQKFLKIFKLIVNFQNVYLLIIEFLWHINEVENILVITLFQRYFLNMKISKLKTIKIPFSFHYSKCEMKIWLKLKQLITIYKK